MVKNKDQNFKSSLQDIHVDSFMLGFYVIQCNFREKLKQCDKKTYLRNITLYCLELYILYHYRVS